jgi:tetratricopeptide (TPR) repeat protein
LAGWLHSPSEAEPLLYLAIETYQSTLGERHPKYIQTLRRLGGVLLMRGAVDESLQTYVQAAQISKMVYGETHPASCAILRELGFAYGWAGRRDNNLEVCEQLVRIAPQVYGEQSARTMEILMVCADARAAVGDIGGSIAGHRQAIELAERIGQATSILVCVSRLALADLVLKAGLDNKEAAAQSQMIIELADVTQGMRPWMQGQAKSLLGEIAIRNRSFADAEALLTSAFELIRGNSLVAHHHRACAERLVCLYDAWHEAEPGTGKDEQAESWRATLAGLQPPQRH